MTNQPSAAAMRAARSIRQRYTSGYSAGIEPGLAKIIDAEFAVAVDAMSECVKHLDVLLASIGGGLTVDGSDEWRAIEAMRAGRDALARMRAGRSFNCDNRNNFQKLT